jgi:hypothetical protein
MSKGSARTLQYWLDRGYDETHAEKMRLSRTPGTIEYFMIYKGMSEEDAVKARDEFQQNRSTTLENMIKKYGDIEGEIKWQLYKDKQAYTNSFEYKKEKYGWSYEQWDKYNKSRGRRSANYREREKYITSYYDRLVEKYGKEKAEEIKSNFLIDGKMYGEYNPNYGSSYYDRWVDKFGKEKADEMNIEVSRSKSRPGILNGNYKRPKRKEEIERMRDSAIKRVIRQGTAVGYNPNSIPILEEYAKDNGYSIQHAENGGEFQVPRTTFFVDAYDHKNNVVIEYDEKYHMNDVQVERDINRQRIIGNILKCKFIRILEDGEIRIFDYSKNNTSYIV